MGRRQRLCRERYPLLTHEGARVRKPEGRRDWGRRGRLEEDCGRVSVNGRLVFDNNVAPDLLPWPLRSIRHRLLDASKRLFLRSAFC